MEHETPFEFQHTVREVEVRQQYIILRDDEGRRYGESLPGGNKAPVVVVDGAARTYRGLKYHPNCVWGGMRYWFRDNAVTEGAVVSVKYDPDESTDGVPILRAVVVQPGAGESSQVANVRRRGRQAAGTAQPVMGPVFADIPRLGRLLIDAVQHRADASFTATEQYLVSLVSYEYGLYQEALDLLTYSLSGNLRSEYQTKAENLRQVCAAKIEEGERRARLGRMTEEVNLLVGKVGPEEAQQLLRQLLDDMANRGLAT